MNKFKVGDKVVPINLSAYKDWDLNRWLNCKFAIQHFFKENGYLFVKEIRPNGRIICSEKLEHGGFNDPFEASDLIPYEEPKPKFKVGDKVKVIANTRGRIHYVFLIGKTGTICNKPFSAKDIYGINFDEDILGHDCKGTCEKGHGYNLPAADLELLKPSFGCKPINHAPENETALKFMGRLTPDGPRIKERYIFNGPATICIITYDGKQFKGVAKCNPKDAWSTAAGQTIAMERASIELSKYRIAQAANR